MAKDVLEVLNNRVASSEQLWGMPEGSDVIGANAIAMLAELIAADVEYDEAIENQIKTFDCDYFDPEVGKARKSVAEAKERRAAALAACRGLK